MSVWHQVTLTVERTPADVSEFKERARGQSCQHCGGALPLSFLALHPASEPEWEKYGGAWNGGMGDIAIDEACKLAFSEGYRRCAWLPLWWMERVSGKFPHLLFTLQVDIECQNSKKFEIWNGKILRESAEHCDFENVLACREFHPRCADAMIASQLCPATPSSV
jgi:hypothetical protein